MKTTVISILDKEFPPSHSFVDGMLSNVLPNKDYQVILIVSKGKSKKNVKKYFHSACITTLCKRKGLSRFWNFFIVYNIIVKLINKKERVILFVRNEPVYLLASSLLRNKVDKLIYQQSFPHERASTNLLKKKVTLTIFSLVKNKVDGIVTVSPKGLERLKGFFPNSTNNMYIPLLINKKELISTDELINKNGNDPIHFIYIGTHASSRRLEVVLEGITNALSQKVNAVFTFVGGNDQEVNLLRKIAGTEKYESNGMIQFIEKIPRKQLLEQLRHYDVGLSIIPCNDIYAESSPTKLVEYMSHGLMVIGSKGIELQEKFINNSKGGILINFTNEEIANSIIKICANYSFVNEMKHNALQFAMKELLYENYVEELRKIL
ncbi:glycosyltransferase [Calidifontibacillus oryziterrae]|uniref:glycosyltransferase n=1 Tax=Calidifontibacillus oryziterrae TaxID=1191699 RepID=UPI00031AE070|nr:glycosyltransferase [Calidifontibacillus oryziterrae]